MTTEEKKQIAEKLEIIDQEGLVLLGEVTEPSETYYDAEHSQDKIEKAIKFIREKLNIPEPIF